MKVGHYYRKTYRDGTYVIVKCLEPLDYESETHRCLILFDSMKFYPVNKKIHISIEHGIIQEISKDIVTLELI